MAESRTDCFRRGRLQLPSAAPVERLLAGHRPATTPNGPRLPTGPNRAAPPPGYGDSPKLRPRHHRDPPQTPGLRPGLRRVPRQGKTSAGALPSPGAGAPPGVASTPGGASRRRQRTQRPARPTAPSPLPGHRSLRGRGRRRRAGAVGTGC